MGVLSSEVAKHFLLSSTEISGVWETAIKDLGMFCCRLVEFGSRELFFRWKVEPSLNFASVDNESWESCAAAY